MDTRMATLAEKLYGIMEKLEDKPSIYMVAPKVVKYSTAISKRNFRSDRSEIFQCIPNG